MNACPICDNEFEDTFGLCPHQKHGERRLDLSDHLLGAIIKDRYQLKDVIGRGSMGVVYRAVQLNDGKAVAIKVLQTHLATDPESLKRFQHEAKAASGLMHPHIVRLYDVGMASGGQPYIAMEYLPGETLANYMKGRQHLNWQDALPIIRQVCEALAEAHSHGVLHRDIKPANIMMLNRFGQENFVVVLDFSIAKVIQRVSDVGSSSPGLILGSPAYMSPERFKGTGEDFRSDIYSMGIIMFQILAGQTPFKSNDLYKLMEMHVNSPPPRVMDIRPQARVPEELERIIARALSKRPEDRPESMRQLLTDVEAVSRAMCAARETALNPEAVSAQHRIVESKQNGQNQSPAKNGRTSADSSLGRAQLESSKTFFEIDPGVVTPMLLPAYPGRRKGSENSASSGHQQLSPELIKSSAWNNSASRGPVSERPRESIGPAETTGKFPFELLAFVTVVLAGICAVISTQMPSDPISVVIQRKIATGELDEAQSLMDSWHQSVKRTQEEDYWILADALGKAYFENRNYAEAGRWFETVPEKSKASAEAHRYLLRLRKTIPTN